MHKDSILWHSWSKKVFEKAKKEDKPLLLFIEHRGCYWCEQMDQDSFGDEKIISLISEHYIAVKVDSHERPDIGRYFHKLFTQMTGREASYPLTIFLSPEYIPLYTASYLPERSRDGMMGLDEIILLVVKKYTSQRELLLSKGREIQSAVNQKPKSIQATKIDSYITALVIDQLHTLYDAEYGGFGDKPKFVRHSVLLLLLDLYEHNRDSQIRNMITNTLDTMCSNGLHDSEDGGFHRYCSDRAWREPYRGKMLYDNALMSQVLMRASRVLNEDSYSKIGLSTIEFMQKELMIESCFCTFYDEGLVKDDRVVISWNAMTIKALFMAGEIDRIYQQMAIESLSKILEYGMQNGILYHSFKIGEELKIEAFLEDYSYLADLLVTAYEQTMQEHYLIKASELINEAIKQFFNQGFWLYSSDDFKLNADTVDGDYPAALSVMARVLYKAAKLIDPAYEKFATRTLEIHSYELMRQPISMPELTRATIKMIS